MVEVTLVSISGGILTVVEPDGGLSNYRQRGIRELDIDTIEKEVNAGRLNANSLVMMDIPYNYVIIVEDEEIMGNEDNLYEYKVGSGNGE